MKMTLNQAAKESGKAKKTILEALKNNRMSGEKNEKGQWEIDPSELFRVFPHQQSNQSRKPKPTPLEKPENHQQISVLEKEVEMLREQLSRSDAERDRWREESESWKEQAAKITALIEDQSARRKGWFARIIGA